MLILPVVVHRPDLFGAGAGADEVDLGFGDAVDAAAHAENDFVGKFVGDSSNTLAGGGILIMLAQNLRRSDVLHVIQPALDKRVAALNRQIAEQLVIARRTADTHIGHILSKLSLHSRAELAAWVVEHGLTANRPN